MAKEEENVTYLQDNNTNHICKEPLQKKQHKRAQSKPRSNHIDECRGQEIPSQIDTVDLKHFS